jgi:hypothetical protein
VPSCSLLTQALAEGNLLGPFYSWKAGTPKAWASCVRAGIRIHRTQASDTTQYSVDIWGIVLGWCFLKNFLGCYVLFCQII